MNRHTPDDSELMAEIARGRTAAMAELYDRYARLVYSVAFQSLSDPMSAEEVTQEVFVQAWQSAASYQPERARLATWLAGITRYRAIDRLRRDSVRGAGAHVPWADVESSLASNDSPEDAYALKAQQTAVRQAVAALPTEQRTALMLAFFQGYSHSEIAEQLALPLGTVKTRIRLAMQKLRDALAAEMDRP